MRKMLSGLVAVLVLGLVVWAMLPRPVWVELADVAPRTIEVVVEEEGEARIREVFTVSATVGGKLQRIILHAGDPVVADETVVALIGPAEPALLDARARAVAEATVAAAEAAVDLARAMVTQAEATLVFMSSEADRARALLERSAVPQRTYDNAILQQITSDNVPGGGGQCTCKPIRPLQERRHRLIQRLLNVIRSERSGDCPTFRIANEFSNLISKCPLAERRKPLAEISCAAPGAGIARTERIDVTKQVFVDQGRKTVKFDQRILQRCRCKQQLATVFGCPANALPDLVARPIGVTKLMGLVDDN